MKTITYNPETHKLVPIEPTIEMQEWGSLRSDYDLSQLRCKYVWQSMLNAAPAAEEAPGQEPDLSGLSQYAKETIRDWLKDGTFVERAIGVMRDQEQELMRYEKQQPASNGVTNTQEPSSGGVLFAVEEAIRNGDCPWQIEQAFDEYEADRKAAIGIRGDV